MKLTRALLAILLLASSTSLFAADLVTQLSLLRQIPADIQKELKGGKPNDQGLVGMNQREGYIGAEYQRGGMDTLIAGAVLHRTDMIDEGFRVADATFARQQPGGGFGDKVATGGAFWITAASSAFLVLKESEYWPQYKAQAEKYYPKFALASKFLVGHLAELEKHDGNTPNRLFIDADALFLTAKLLGTDVPTGARELREKGLALYDKKSGAFQENGGGDSSYQAVNLKMLMLYVTYYPSEDIGAIIRKGLNWELTKISADGEISTEGNSRSGVGKEIYFGHAKEVNYREVSEMFAYAGQMFHDDRYTQAALRIRQHKGK